MNRTEEIIEVPEKLATIPMPGTQKGQAVLFKDHTWVPIIAGGSPEGDGEGGEGEGDGGAGAGAPADGSAGDGIVPAEGAKPAEGDGAGEEEAVFQIGDEKFTATQVETALNMTKNQDEINTKNQQKSEELNTLARVIEGTRQGLSNQPVNTPATVPANNLSTMTGAQLQEALLGENPEIVADYIDNLVNTKVDSAANSARAENAFMTEHPDYLQTLSSPDYKTYIAQNPMGQYLNDVNGFLSYKLSTTGNDVKNAETTGFKAGETKTLANIKAKGNLKVLNSGGGVTPPTITKITPESSSGEVANAATAALIASRSG